jgi:hypothetical protein
LKEIKKYLKKKEREKTWKSFERQKKIILEEKNEQ